MKTKIKVGGAMPTYIQELIDLSHRVCMTNLGSPHTLIQLLNRHRAQYADDLRSVIGQWRNRPTPLPRSITEYKKSIISDLAEIDKAIARTNFKIAVRGF